MISVLALGTSACGKKGGPPPRHPVIVKMANAVKTTLPVVISAYGTTQDRENVDVVPQVSGILLTILVQEGAVVTNGQPLFQIDARDYASRVQQAEGMVAVDRSNVELARSTLQRNQPLLEKHLISLDTFDTIKTKVASLEAQLRWMKPSWIRPGSISPAAPSSRRWQASAPGATWMQETLRQRV